MKENDACLYFKSYNKRAYLSFGDVTLGNLVRFINRPSRKSARAFWGTRKIGRFVLAIGHLRTIGITKIGRLYVFGTNSYWESREQKPYASFNVKLEYLQL